MKRKWMAALGRLHHSRRRIAVRARPEQVLKAFDEMEQTAAR
jgi:hypothetical protein